MFSTTIHTRGCIVENKWNRFEKMNRGFVRNELNKNITNFYAVFHDFDKMIQ